MTLPDERLEFAIALAREAGRYALGRFREIDSLVIESKGHQDLVSDADRNTETLIRNAIAERFPDDGIVGEEHGRIIGTTGHDWVIDPIDGTANFVRGIPQWCVVIACTHHSRAETGVIYEPCSDEMFAAARGRGTTCNGRTVRVSTAASIGEGSIGTGFSGRVHGGNIVGVVARIVAEGGMFFRNASGALMLAYVASGRLLGYVEEHMNSWDCLAGLLMVEEAGGRIVQPDPATVLDHGTVVIGSGPGVFEAVTRITDEHFDL